LQKYGIKLDLDREKRIGLDEAVYSESKSAAQLSALVEHASRHRQRRLFTRLSQQQFDALPARHRRLLDYDPVSRTAVFGRRRPLAYRAPLTAIVCAGSSDLAVSKEAERTLEYFGHPSALIADVGVAGLWRLTERLADLVDKRVVIVAAGMDGALPSVVGGLVAGVVIAIPTSVGYGAAAGGHAALHSALASCAPGVVVVNVDNGYGAACAALRVLGTRSGAPRGAKRNSAGR
jgi:NCAIR mutase (PurE)-related protein